MSIAKTCHLESFFPRPGTGKKFFSTPFLWQFLKIFLMRGSNGLWTECKMLRQIITFFIKPLTEGRGLLTGGRWKADDSNDHVPWQAGEEEGREYQVEFARISPVMLLCGNVLNSAPRTKQWSLSQQLSVPWGKAKSPGRCKSLGDLCGEAKSSAEGSSWTWQSGQARYHKLWTLQIPKGEKLKGIMQWWLWWIIMKREI